MVNSHPRTGVKTSCHGTFRGIVHAWAAAAHRSMPWRAPVGPRLLFRFYGSTSLALASFAFFISFSTSVRIPRAGEGPGPPLWADVPGGCPEAAPGAPKLLHPFCCPLVTRCYSLRPVVTSSRAGRFRQLRLQDLTDPDGGDAWGRRQ